MHASERPALTAVSPPVTVTVAVLVTAVTAVTVVVIVIVGGVLRHCWMLHLLGWLVGLVGLGGMSGARGQTRKKAGAFQREPKAYDYCVSRRCFLCVLLVWDWPKEGRSPPSRRF